MSDAIEVLKDLKRQYSDYCNEYQLEDDNKFIDALDEALLALDSVESLKARVTSLSEQKEKLKELFSNELLERIIQDAYKHGIGSVEIDLRQLWEEIKELEEGVSE